MVEVDDSSDDECDVEGDDELPFHELLFDGHPGGGSSGPGRVRVIMCLLARPMAVLLLGRYAARMGVLLRPLMGAGLHGRRRRRNRGTRRGCLQKKLQEALGISV
ncbi:unnamed protein product [Linum trigynum]